VSVVPTFGGVFPLGTHVFREPCLDVEPILADLPLLKRAGFNMIKIQEHWSHDEPRQGEYQFERVERVIAGAKQLGLGIYLGLTMEQAPAWLYQRYPDCRLVYANGLPHDDPTQYCLPVDGKPGPCWDHPGTRQAASTFIRTLAGQLGRYENIWCWNTWQEIGFWHNDGGALGFCYCPHTLAAFRTWLQTVYTDLAALNRAWCSAYGEWDEVQPPRRNAFNPPFIDWRRFMDDVYITNALSFKTAALRAGDPQQRPVFSHVGTPTIGSGAEWRWARAGDFFGNSNYPAWGSHHAWDDGANDAKEQHACERIEIWQGLMLRGDYTRNATGSGRTFWGAEFQGGPVSTHLHFGRVPRAADIRRWMLSGLAAGMHGISFWNHRVEVSWQECNGFGLLDARGETSERFEEAGRIGRALQNHTALFSQGEPPRAQVALIVNQDLWHWAQGTQNHAAELLSYNLRGHYARLWKLGIAVDFVEADDIATGALAGYPAAILPFPLALDPGFFAHLHAYVEQGGTLISEACPGRFDRLGFCVRPEMVTGAEELFGVRQQRVQIVCEPGDERRWTPQERTWGEFAPATMLEGADSLAGLRLRASFYLQTLLPLDGTPILFVEQACVGVRKSHGAGTAILLGTYAGLSATAHADHESDAFMAGILAEAGVVADLCGQLIRRRRVDGSQEAWFLINPHDQAVSEIVALESFVQVSDLLGEPLNLVDSQHFHISIPATSIQCVIVQR
jgi:beta-galactosidase